MLSELKIYFNNYADFKWKMCGTNEYVQVMIEPGAELGNWVISELCNNLDCCSSVSCIHSDLMGGYCLMIEFYK